jgi:hypothetical protein
MHLSIFAPIMLVQSYVSHRPSLRLNADQIVPPPPKPESIEVSELPLPPVIPNDTGAACTVDINPRGTGCIGKETGLFGGNFLPDGNHVVAAVTFAGAPAAPDPASVYFGDNLIIVKADGTTFPNGDAWKCITCGTPISNSLGRDFNTDMRAYPQAFYDGSRVLVGTNIVSCGNFQLASVDCVPERTFIYPIRWQAQTTPLGRAAVFANYAFILTTSTSASTLSALLAAH